MAEPAEGPSAAPLRELEERAGAFQREAVANSALVAELEATLAVCDGAQGRLLEALARARGEIQRWREEAERLRSRVAGFAAELEEKTAQAVESARLRDEARGRLKESSDAAARENARLRAELDEARRREREGLEEVARRGRQLEAERARLRDEAQAAMSSAEIVRREGIEALEEARELRKRQAE